MIRYVFNDACSPNTERNDCTVRTLAITTKTPYLRAFAILSNAGRKRNRGFHIQNFLKANKRVCGHFFKKLSFRNPVTVNKFVQRYPAGTYYVLIRGHVFAIMHGTVHDMIEPKPGQRITMAWRVEQIDNSCT
jgi:hypothetical protein